MKNSYSSSVSTSLLGRDTSAPLAKGLDTAKVQNSQDIVAKEVSIKNPGAPTVAPGRPTLESKGLKKRKQITITLTEEMHQETMRFARAENISLAKFIENALIEYKTNHHLE